SDGPAEPRDERHRVRQRTGRSHADRRPARAGEDDLAQTLSYLTHRSARGNHRAMRSERRLALVVTVIGLVLAARPSDAAPQLAKPPPPAAPKSPPPAAAKTPPTAPVATTTAGGRPASPSKNASTKGVRATENGARRVIAGGPTYDDAALGADTPELRALA